MQNRDLNKQNKSLLVRIQELQGIVFSLRKENEMLKFNCEDNTQKIEDLVSVSLINEDSRNDLSEKLRSCSSQLDLKCNEALCLKQNITCLENTQKIILRQLKRL